MSLMLDLRYEGLHVITDYVEYKKTMHVVVEYDQIILVPLLVKVL